MTDIRPTHRHKPAARRETADQLRARIPGWGADLDPKDRPSVPKRAVHQDADRRALGVPRAAAGEVAARAVGRARLPDAGVRHGPAAEGPVRGDPEALLRRYSEGRAAHWLLLVARRPRRRRGGATSAFLRHTAAGQPGHRDRGAERVHPLRALVTSRARSAPISCTSRWTRSSWPARGSPRGPVRCSARAAWPGRSRADGTRAAGQTSVTTRSRPWRFAR